MRQTGLKLWLNIPTTNATGNFDNYMQIHFNLVAQMAVTS